jgi:AraC-like DNA-binding protein
MADVRAIRAQYARELILGTHLPLKEIAPRAGLGNEYSMSRLFRRVFQMPPGQYRRFQARRGGEGGRRTDPSVAPV